MNNLNNETLNDTDFYDNFIRIGSFFPLVIIVIGVVGNLFSFIIIITNKYLNKLSTMTFLAFITILNTISLFHWNLDHFLDPNFHVKIVNANMITCKLFTFLQYTTLQSTGLITCLICIDLYLILGLKANPYNESIRAFTTRKTAIIWCLVVILFISVVDLHFLMLNGYWEYNKQTINNKTLENGTFIIQLEAQNSPFKCYNYPLNYGILLDIWQHVVNIFYNYIPIVVIIPFSFLIAYRLYKSKHTDCYIITNEWSSFTVQMDQCEMLQLGTTGLVVSLLFVFMTSPTQLMYTYWFDLIKMNKHTKMVSIIADSVLFLQHSSTFYVCFLTYPLFRKAVFNFFKCFNLGLSDYYF